MLWGHLFVSTNEKEMFYKHELKVKYVKIKICYNYIQNILGGK